MQNLRKVNFRNDTIGHFEWEFFFVLPGIDLVYDLKFGEKEKFEDLMCARQNV